jgi:hypothetical protein
MLFGLKDIHTVIANQRKIGGAAEADSIRLSSGETYLNPVFTNVDFSKGQYLSVGFIDEEGQNIKGLEHKLICQLNNDYIKQMFVRDTLQYLQKLCEVNAGFVTKTFKKEALRLVQDISVNELKKHNISLPFPVEEKIVKLA